MTRWLLSSNCHCMPAMVINFPLSSSLSYQYRRCHSIWINLQSASSGRYSIFVDHHIRTSISHFRQRWLWIIASDFSRNRAPVIDDADDFEYAWTKISLPIILRLRSVPALIVAYWKLYTATVPTRRAELLAKICELGRNSLLRHVRSDNRPSHNIYTWHLRSSFDNGEETYAS